MEQKLTEREVLDVLHAIERGEVTIPKEQRDKAFDSFCGNVPFDCSNGWRFIIFNDVNEWDYIDSVTAPDGRLLVIDDIWGMPELNGYSPPTEVGMRVWGLES